MPFAPSGGPPPVARSQTRGDPGPSRTPGPAPHGGRACRSPAALWDAPKKEDWGDPQGEPRKEPHGDPRGDPAPPQPVFRCRKRCSLPRTSVGEAVQKSMRRDPGTAFTFAMQRDSRRSSRSQYSSSSSEGTCREQRRPAVRRVAHRGPCAPAALPRRARRVWGGLHQTRQRLPTSNSTGARRATRIRQGIWFSVGIGPGLRAAR